MNENPFFNTVEPAPYLNNPALSPDGGILYFVLAGDIWSVPSDGGEGHQVTSHVGYDSCPRISPCGSSLAFVSQRTGNGDIYTINLESGEISKLTHHSGANLLGGWSPDSNWLYFTSRRDGLSGAIYKVHVDGGTPIEVLVDSRETHEQPTVSPNGQVVAFVNNGIPWWRRGPHPAGASAIWTVDEAAEADNHLKLTTYAGRNICPMWSEDDTRLYYISDEGGSENIWAIQADGENAGPLTNFQDGRCLRATVSANGRTIAFERNDQIWKLDVEIRETNSIDIHVLPDQKTNPRIHRTFTDDIDEFHLSPDGKKALFAVHGELFAAPSEFEDTYNAIRVTQLPSANTRQTGIQIAGPLRMFQIGLVTTRYSVEEKETCLTDDGEQKYFPRHSPDGNWIAYLHGREEIRLIGTQTGESLPFARWRLKADPT